MPNLDLSVSCDTTNWGEEVAVVGSWNSWSKKHFTKLVTSPSQFPVWHASISLTDNMAKAPVEYKYVIVKSGAIARWEGNGTRCNRVANVLSENKILDVYGRIDGEPQEASHVSGATREWHGGTQGGPMNPNANGLGTLEKAIIEMNMTQKSWRQRLAFVRALFTDDEAAKKIGFNKHSIDALATISTYLSFLSNGQVKCEEDGGHHRPNHHALEAQKLEAALDSIVKHVMDNTSLRKSSQPESYIPYVIRKVYPQLPSYSSQFTTSVPLTRIRDIAHRNDIPHDFKQEIKRTLQNKLHRCAGPEDLQTSARLLERINNSDFSHDFKKEFAIFHAELCEFFNVSSLDSRLQYLIDSEHVRSIAHMSASLLTMRKEKRPAHEQFKMVTELRSGLSDLSIMKANGNKSQADLPSEHVQKVRLADVDLESYAFVLLAEIAADIEEHVENSMNWSYSLNALSNALLNIGLSSILPSEATAAAAELSAVSQIADGFKTEKLFLLRSKAASDRALRLTHSFSVAISDVYNRRARLLGRGLGVNEESISVFAEAEIRANVTFQASRIANALCKCVRRELNLPPWDPLYNGSASGRVVFAEKLGDVMNIEEDVLAICRQADGDEDIAACVRGVILGRSLPHLSHLGVRARQSGVVFVCAEDQEVFERVWNRRHLQEARMLVTSEEGLASLSPLSEPQEAHSHHGAENFAAVQVRVDFDGRDTKPIAISEATKGNSSSKCALIGELYKLAQGSNGLFYAANGMVVPHGVFQQQRRLHEEEYKRLVQSYQKGYEGKMGTDEAAQALRSLIEEKFELDVKWCKLIQEGIEGGDKVMVRSSANAEDLENMSGAGLYDSIANVAVMDTRALQKAVGEVWGSLWTKRAASSRDAYGVAHDKVSMAVVIQQMVRSELSFVAFSHDPVSKDGDAVYMEIAVGMGETLASGGMEGSPYRLKVERGSLEVETVSFGSVSVMLEADGERGLRERVVDYSKQRLTTEERFRTTLGRRIAQTVLRLEAQLQRAQDVEGAVTTSDGEAQLFVVQTRAQME
ncbi:Phosphoglucan, water dikinase, chloroplastic [Gracilariopsis chorda]|uniref:Phosphoglucan, water dikinase, chloroplastic n=1 Tax=Gracilariopsis chorda TaxID=448386 RepID=A0A2V3INM2_9FLOR|nr:Phosphoglucan, water dikinase, chloroplastic [Gracilariopsis chorda]|eukprot:PXF43672.1 Phosphoglucan, water dikinase, chloroplastic [Gracilariopsis chorda]